jgi:hypothetical protein
MIWSGALAGAPYTTAGKVWGDCSVVAGATLIVRLSTHRATRAESVRALPVMWFIVKLEKELEMCGLAKLFLCRVTLPTPE